MRRLALLPLLLAACVNDTVEGVPSIEVGVNGDNVVVEFLQQPDHAFKASLTINGVAAPAPQIFPGHIPSSNSSPFADQPSPASATFAVPLGALTGPGVHVVLEDSGDLYTVDIPQLLAKRTLTASMPATLHAGDAIALDTGVTGDLMTSYASSSPDCLDLYGDTSLVVPPADQWRCGSAPANVSTTLSIKASITPQITKCDGPDVTCVPALVEEAELDLPATLSF